MFRSRSGLIVQTDNLRNRPIYARAKSDRCSYHLRGAAAVKHDAAVFVRCVAILNGQALHDCGPESRGRDCLIDYEQVYFEAVKASKPAAMPKWLEFAPEKLEGKIIALPARDDIDSQISEHMIVELYSK